MKAICIAPLSAIVRNGQIVRLSTGTTNAVKTVKTGLKNSSWNFCGDVLPCSDFDANALYFMICALSFNLFELMRRLLPEELSHHRVITHDGRFTLW